jgi:hypothetical protein
MWRAKIPLVVVLCFAVLAVLVVWRFHQQDSARTPQQESRPGDRLGNLKRLVAEQENGSLRAVEQYKPTLKGQLTDLTCPVRDLLAGLPGVVEVEQPVQCDKPVRRVIHLRDWHLVPHDVYAIDLATSARRPLAADEVARLHAELLLEVEAVQAEQMAVLRCLIRHHGLRRVYSEGVTPAGLSNYRDIIKTLSAMEKDEIPAARRQLAEVRELLASMRGQDGSDPYRSARGIEAELAKMLDDHRDRLLEFGAAGRLFIAGELEDVLPLDDDDALEASRPVTTDGRVKLDKAKVRAREEAQVRLLLAGDPVAVIVLGGKHDLSHQLRAVAGGRVEYLRVTTSMYRRFSSP